MRRFAGKMQLACSISRHPANNSHQVMMKSLSHMKHESIVWCNTKWKSWNTTGIQADSGESRISDDAVAQDSKVRIAVPRQRLLGRVNLHYVSITQHMIRTHTFACEPAGRTPDSGVPVHVRQIRMDASSQLSYRRPRLDHERKL